jgi:PTS system nitrogen regulatory IIA component
MNLKKAISAETVLLDMKSDTKEGVIVELIDALMKAGKVRDLECRQEAIKAVMDRERKMSTGMQNGIAISPWKNQRC